jgi:hypothetical protein
MGMEITQHIPANKSLSLLIAEKLQEISQLLVKPIDASALATFRVFFGVIMVWEVYRYHAYGRVARYYIEPHFYFPYELFPFLSPLSGPGMYLVFFLLGLSALGIALGFFYRPSAILFFLTYTYVFLLDKTQYNNHYYLISLLGFLLIFTDAHRWTSIDQKLRPDLQTEVIPYWQSFIFKAQLFIVYFYAAIAKMNGDWLVGEPIRDWLQARAHYPVLGPFFATEPGVYVFAYGGLLFDLFIGFLLLWRPTRLPAFLALLAFHLMNGWLFSIGIFPYLMIAATVLFVEPDWPRRLLRSASLNKPSQPVYSEAYRKWAFGFVVIYLALQIFIPFRHWLYPGNVSWTEEGHRFSWHMKLRSKSGRISFTITDPQTQQTWPVDMTADLNARQISKMATRPDMIIQYAHYLKQKAEQAGIQNPIIRVEAWASLNGRPYQPLIDPEANLAELPQTIFARADWIVPLQADLLPGSRETTFEED